MTAPPSELIAEIAARYRAGVAPDAKLQRLPTGLSSRPYPVWDENKRQLIVPDWKEQKERMHRASMRAGRKRADAARAVNQGKMDLLRELHARGASVRAMAEALGIAESYCRSLLSREGLRMQVEPGPKPETLARVALIQKLIAEGETREAIAAAAGFAQARHLCHFMRRSMPGVAMPKLAARVTASRKAAGQSASRTCASRRADRGARIAALVAEGADEARIGAEVGISCRRHLRRVIRTAVPGYTQAPRRRDSDVIQDRDAKIVALLADHTYAEIADMLALTRNQVAVAIRRLRAAGGLVPARRNRTLRKRERNVEPELAALEGRVVAAYQSGQRVALIAEAESIRPARVNKILCRNGVQRVDWRRGVAAQRRAELPQLVAQGLSGAEIAARWGVTVPTVWSMASYLGLDMDAAARDRQREQRAVEKATMHELVKVCVQRGMTDADICKTLNRSRSAVQRMVAELGLRGVRKALAKGGAA